MVYREIKQRKEAGALGAVRRESEEERAGRGRGKFATPYDNREEMVICRVCEAETDKS